MKSLLALVDASLALLYPNQLLGQDDVYFTYYVFVLESRLAVSLHRPCTLTPKTEGTYN